MTLSIDMIGERSQAPDKELQLCPSGEILTALDVPQANFEVPSTSQVQCEMQGKPDDTEIQGYVSSRRRRQRRIAELVTLVEQLEQSLTILRSESSNLQNDIQSLGEL